MTKAIHSIVNKPLGALLVALVLAFYGCGNAPDTAPSGSQEEAHDHEHGEGEDHEHEHEDGHDHEHEEDGDHDHEHAEEGEHDHEHAEGGHGHTHEAPHGGTLVAVGDHFAHLEIVLDPETGKMTAYVLDGEAENPIRLKQGSMEFSLALKTDNGGTTVTMLELAGVENALTGSHPMAYELLMERDLRIQAEIIMRIQHTLMVTPGTKLSNLRRVRSSSQSLRQCEKFIQRYKLEEIPAFERDEEVFCLF